MPEGDAKMVVAIYDAYTDVTLARRLASRAKRHPSLGRELVEALAAEAQDDGGPRDGALRGSRIERAELALLSAKP